jgi:predicted ATPase
MMKYVITGGACTGKTTMINELKRRGYQIVGESARIIIDSEQVHEKMNPAYDGVYPWTDNHAFQLLVVKLQKMLEDDIVNREFKHNFLDRSLVDGIAYAKIWKTEEVEGLREEIAKARYTTIFFLEQLGFYNMDEQRQESELVNREVHDKLFEIYTELGFDVVRVPPLPIDERVEFVLERVKNGKEKETLS